MQQQQQQQEQQQQQQQQQQPQRGRAQSPVLRSSATTTAAAVAAAAAAPPPLGSPAIVMGNLDGFDVNTDHLQLAGWVVDPGLTPLGPSNVTLFVDGECVRACVRACVSE